LVVGLNELIDKELKTVIDNQVERINDYLNFLDQRIQAKNKDIKFLSEKIVKKKQKHVSNSIQYLHPKV
jgi:flagellar biosynthesis chaperone FliJ